MTERRDLEFKQRSGVLLGLAFLCAPWACAPVQENPLAGAWTVVGASPEAPCVFARGTTVMLGDSVAGRAAWAATGADCVFDGSVPYLVTESAGEGLRLAIGAWGPELLAGRMVEGKVERHGPDRFRYEFNLGGAEEMPGGTGSQTIRFVREVN